MRDQGSKFSSFLGSGLKILGKNMGSVTTKYTSLRPWYLVSVYRPPGFQDGCLDELENPCLLSSPMDHVQVIYSQVILTYRITSGSRHQCQLLFLLQVTSHYFTITESILNIHKS